MSKARVVVDDDIKLKHTVYVVSRGTGVDKRILGAFLTLNDASKFIAVFDYELEKNEYDVVRLPINPCMEMIDLGLELYFVRLPMHGGKNYVERVRSFDLIHGPRVSDFFICYVWATSPEEATELASNKRWFWVTNKPGHREDVVDLRVCK